MMEIKYLEEIGFSKGEVKVYFSLIELGESTIGPISKKSGVTMSKTYPILNKLIEKGLITSVIKSGTNYFQAFNPASLLKFIENKRKKLKEDEDYIKELIPILLKRQTSEAKKSATVYEGYNGLKSLYEEFVDYLKNSKEDFIAFTLGEEYEDPNLMNFFEHYDNKRNLLGIKTKLIGVEKQRKYFNKKYLKSVGLEIRYLPYASVPQGEIIVGDRVATMVWGKQTAAFVIQSKETAEAHKKFFWDLWKIAKK